MKKSYLSIITASALTAGIILDTSALTVSAKDSQILFIGDAAAAGAQLNTGEYAFPDIIADVCGKNAVYETDISYTTEKVIELLETDKFKEEISSSDTICISLGTNDILIPLLELFDLDEYSSLQNAVSSIDMTDSRIKSAYGALQKASDAASENIDIICEDISKLNPDALIVVQTLYNPLSVDTSGSDWDQSEKSKFSLACAELDNSIIQTANGTIKRIKGAAVSDIYTEFKDNADFFTGINNLDVYPNQTGHIVIAQNMLNAMGIEKGSSEVMTSAYNTVPTEKRAEFKNRFPEKYASVSIFFGSAPQRGSENPDTPDNTVLGDVNSDGKIDAKDATVILVDAANTILGKKSTADKSAADVNKDGKIDAKDATVILRYAAEKMLGRDVTIEQIAGK